MLMNGIVRGHWGWWCALGAAGVVVRWWSTSGVSEWCHSQCSLVVGGIVAPVTWRLGVMQVVVGLGHICIIVSGDVAQGSHHWRVHATGAIRKSRR